MRRKDALVGTRNKVAVMQYVFWQMVLGQIYLLVLSLSNVASVAIILLLLQSLSAMGRCCLIFR